MVSETRYTVNTLEEASNLLNTFIPRLLQLEADVDNLTAELERLRENATSRPPASTTSHLSPRGRTGLRGLANDDRQLRDLDEELTELNEEIMELHGNPIPPSKDVEIMRRRVARARARLEELETGQVTQPATRTTHETTTPIHGGTRRSLLGDLWERGKHD